MKRLVCKIAENSTVTPSQSLFCPTNGPNLKIIKNALKQLHLHLNTLNHDMFLHENWLE